MKRSILLTLILVALVTLPSTMGVYGNGTNGYWVTTADSVLDYKHSLTLKFKMNTDYNFGQFNSFEAYIVDANTTAPVNPEFLNEHITKNISVNSNKTEVTVTLTSQTIYYTDAIENGLDDKAYYIKVDLKKNGDTVAGVDTFGAIPIRVIWDLNDLDLSQGAGWTPTSPELDYTRSLIMTYEGYEDQFKFISSFDSYAFGINGFDTTLKSDYFKVSSITKLNNRSIRLTFDSEQIPTELLYEKVIEAKKYDAYILFHPDLKIPTKTFKVDMTELPAYSSGTGIDSGTTIAQLQGEITAKNATISALQTQVTTLQAQVGGSTDVQTELTELRGLRNTVVSLAFDYGALNDSTSGALASYLGQMAGDAKKWTSDGQLRPVSCPTTNCPTCQTCNYSSYVAKTTYDGVVAEKTALETQKGEVEDQLKNAVQTRNIYLIGAGLVALVLGLFIGYKSAPKNGNRPRPPVGPPVDQRLKPHRHKGGVPPQSTHVKKKELIGRD